jgi:isoleucyl-tRNA synthetase
MIETNNLEKNVPLSDNILDKWVVSMLNILIRKITERLDDYDTAEAIRLLFSFIEDLSTWYIKNSRRRFKSEDIGEKSSAINTLTYVLLNLSKLLAPLTPFISEMIYQKLKERGFANFESVHLDTWPDFDENLIDTEIHEKILLSREIVKRTLQLREKSKIPLRQILQKVRLRGVTLNEEYLDVIARAVNVREVIIENEDEKDLLVDLDLEITSELRLEGIARNLIRHVNNYRKKLKLSTKNRIDLYLTTKSQEILDSLENHEEKIKKQIQADNIFKNLEGKKGDKKFNINNHFIEAYIEVKN